MAANDDDKMIEDPTVEESDRISEMPVEILAMVVANLSLREIKDTAKLSRSWRDVWTESTYLDLGQLPRARNSGPLAVLYDQSIWIDSVKKAFQVFQRPESVRVAWPVGVAPQVIHNFIREIIAKRVICICIASPYIKPPYVFTIDWPTLASSQLERLDIYRCCVQRNSSTRWPKVAQLTLQEVLFTTGGPLDAVPDLGFYVVPPLDGGQWIPPVPGYAAVPQPATDTVLTSLVASCTALKIFEFRNCSGIRNFQIASPTLCCLQVSSRQRPISVSFKDMPNLSRATIILGRSDRCSAHTDWKASDILSLFQAVCPLVRLQLDVSLEVTMAFCGPSCSAPKITEPACFHQLTFLNLSLHIDLEAGVRLFHHILQCSPKLEYIVFTPKRSTPDLDQGICKHLNTDQIDFWNVESLPGLDCYQSLLLINIHDVQPGDKAVENMVKFLMEKANRLLRLNIVSRTEELLSVDVLRSMYKSSAHLEISVFGFSPLEHQYKDIKAIRAIRQLIDEGVYEPGSCSDSVKRKTAEENEMEIPFCGNAGTDKTGSCSKVVKRRKLNKETILSPGFECGHLTQWAGYNDFATTSRMQNAYGTSTCMDLPMIDQQLEQLTDEDE